MFGIDWNDQSLWLNVTNLALGVVTLAAVLSAVAAVARDATALDDELRAIFDAASPHVMSVPGLGLTMADGGEPVKPEPNTKKESNSDSRK